MLPRTLLLVRYRQMSVAIIILDQTRLPQNKALFCSFSDLELLSIQSVFFQPDNDDRMGESDGFTIWIARMKMSDEELVS